MTWLTICLYNHDQELQQWIIMVNDGSHMATISLLAGRTTIKICYHVGYYCKELLDTHHNQRIAMKHDTYLL